MNLGRLTPVVQAQIIRHTVEERFKAKRWPKRLIPAVTLDLIARRIDSTTDMGGGLAMLSIGYNEVDEAYKRARKAT